MNSFNISGSTILIVNDIAQTTQQLIKQLPLHSTRIIKNEDETKDDFLIAHATATIKEAYIASNSEKYIILCSSNFTKVAQNSLLKVLEEPPKNIIFILVTNAKSSLLPTIISRMSLKYLKHKIPLQTSELNVAKLDLKQIYSFLKQNQRISKHDAKQLVESLLYKAHASNMRLNSKELESFSTSIKLLELNSKPINVLSTLLLTLMHCNYHRPL
jgi:DNA polymerase-3 subunit delta'